MSKPANDLSPAQEREYLQFRRKLYKRLLKEHADDPVLGPFLERSLNGIPEPEEKISPEQARRYRTAAKRIRQWMNEASEEDERFGAALEQALSEGGIRIGELKDEDVVGHRRSRRTVSSEQSQEGGVMGKSRNGAVADQAAKNRKLLQVLRKWMTEDPEYDQKVGALLEKELNQSDVACEGTDEIFARQRRPGKAVSSRKRSKPARH